jgi:hypothetical protein
MQHKQQLRILVIPSAQTTAAACLAIATSSVCVMNCFPANTEAAVQVTDIYVDIQLLLLLIRRQQPRE